MKNIVPKRLIFQGPARRSLAMFGELLALKQHVVEKKIINDSPRVGTIILTDVIGMCVVRARPNWVSEMHPRGR